MRSPFILPERLPCLSAASPLQTPCIGNLTVIQHQKIMLKQAIPSNLPVKSKSPYARQLQDFERRLERRPSSKLPALPLKARKASLVDSLREENEYLELAKRLMQNRERINFCEDKENLFEALERGTEELTCMKNKLGRVKNRLSHQSEPQSTEAMENASLQFPLMGVSKGLRENTSNNRSRALSNAQPEREEAPNFLTYKKGKRELSSRQREN